MDFWTRMATTADRWSVLRHPFYVRWSSGDLTADELALYAGQYAHAVLALACASRYAADVAPAAIAGELAEHAAEEQAHVQLWTHFAECVGAEAGARPLPETADCVTAWSAADRGLLPTLVSLYAIESAQPSISETKLEGLRRHYGVAEGPATEYFTVHAVRDIDHAASAKRLISRKLDGAGPQDRASDAELVYEAERVLAANWRLLDGVENAGA
jgi:pyrroloquinoline-quinone synthase